MTSKKLAGYWVLILFSGLLPVATAQDLWEVPRTASGVPDLQGVWNSATITTLERDPALGDTLIVDSEEALRLEQTSALNVLTASDNAPSDPNRAPPTDGDTDAGYNAFWIDPGTRLAQISGEYRTSFIVDPPNGRIPYTAAAGQAFMAYGQSSGYDGPEQRPLGERCMVGFGSTGGPPMLPVLYNNHYQIVQNDKYVMILVEMNHDARIIRLDSAHLHEDYKPWLGDSVGHWDGDTLVVETRKFHPQQSFRFAIKHSLYLPPTAKVIERFSRTGPAEILYEFTVEDEIAYSQPWTAQIPLHAATGALYEYACHEGNYALTGILAGARRVERATPN
ncbi:MAG: hypothetical protein O2971_01460 [Proteobacteria bacterium]|nr:hypothetical protein [Pseudomonadota bacterium]